MYVILILEHDLLFPIYMNKLCVQECVMLELKTVEEINKDDVSVTYSQYATFPYVVVIVVVVVVVVVCFATRAMNS